MGTPVVRAAFGIFIREHHFKRSAPMVEVNNIFGQEAISRKSSDEQFIDPFIDALAHSHRFTWLRGTVPSDNHANVRPFLLHLQPTSIKQLDLFIGAHSCDARCRWMLQEKISSSSRQQGDASRNELGNRNGITVE